MGIKKLKELLAIIGSVKPYYWDTTVDIAACIKKGNGITIVSKEWADSYKKNSPDHYPLDLSDMKTWSTYEKCIDGDFSIGGFWSEKPNDGKLHYDVKVYDGEMLDGRRKSLRFTAEIILPDSFITKLSRSIEHGFESYLKNQYENHLERQKRNWITKERNKILNR